VARAEISGLAAAAPLRFERTHAYSTASLFMRQLGLAVAAIASLVGALDGADEKARVVAAELKKFEGNWKFEMVEVEGETVPLDESLADRLIFRGDRFTAKTRRESATGVFKVDPTVTPKTIEVTMLDGPSKGKTHHGIYKLEGDRYTVCMAFEGRPVPTQFATRPGSGCILEVLKREKP
jgi:uncharacterized protein (TIGR03067 family)